MHRFLATFPLVFLTFARNAAAAEPAVAVASPTVSAGAQGVTIRSRPALADIGPQPPLESVEHRWYGWQTLATDGAALGLFTLSIAATEMRDSSTSEVLGVMGAAAYVAGGPTVHFAHGHVGKGFGSLGLRVGLPVAGALTATAIARPCGGDFGCIGEAALGFLLGGVSAIAIDAAVLGHEEVVRPRQGLTATPVVAATPNSAWLGVQGAF
ncbi:MAG: hypothetical protein QM756_09655 [Polyangiaceae bacterium]